MIDRTKKLLARFYVTTAGSKPVREWILEMSDADRHRIGKDIQKVEFGWPIGRPHCMPLGHGLWEVRWLFDPSIQSVTPDTLRRAATAVGRSLRIERV